MAHARIRTGRTASARELFLDISLKQIPPRLGYVVVAFSVLAVSNSDLDIRALALRAIHALSPPMQEDSQNVRELIRGLNDDETFG